MIIFNFHNYRKYVNIIPGCEHIAFLIFLLVLSNLSIGIAQSSYDYGYSKADTIIVASEPDYPPFCIVNEQGEADGFAVELFKEAAKAVNLHAEMRIGVWNTIKHDLANGKIDALPFVGRTPEREKLYDFTMTYLSLHGAVFVRDGYDEINDPSDLHGKNIIVMKGDNAEEFLRREKVTEKIITTHTFEEAFRMLAKGKHDAVVTQRVMGINLLEQMNINNVHPLEFQLEKFRQDFCFAVQKGNKHLNNRLNEGLSIIIANNTYRKIKEKWLGPEEGPSKEVIVRNLLLFLIPILIFAVILWILFLRREVKRRTSTLNKEINQHKKTLESLRMQQVKLQESESNIRLLLDSTAEGIFRIDTEGNCTLINSSGLELLGYDREEELRGQNMHNIVHHTKKDGSRCKLEDCNIFNSIRYGKGTSSSDTIFWQKDGNSFDVEYFSYPIIEASEVKGSVVTFLGCHRKKKAEQELIKLKDNLEAEVNKRTAELKEKVSKLNKSQKAMLYMVEDLNKITAELKEERHKLELSNKELEAFTYSVSHDLRAPLRAINGYSKFLEEDYKTRLDDEGIRYLATIRRNALKMDQLITDLLNLSRISRANLRIVQTDMNYIVRSVFKEIASEEEKATFEFKTSDMPNVYCDENLMRQVWQNLISNALKYSSKATKKRIEIYSKTDKSFVYFYIQDYGAGFNEKYVNKLFGVFQRLHKDTDYPGTGVGLAIVQRIIQRHGGEISAESKTEQGARFVFSLPL